MPLLSLEQIANAITLLTISASICPEESPQVRLLLDDLLTLFHQCEGDLGTDHD
jgi:hypothetical protein